MTKLTNWRHSHAHRHTRIIKSSHPMGLAAQPPKCLPAATRWKKNDKTAYNNTCEVADALAGHKLNADQDDYFALLCDLIDAYDKENSPPDPHVSGLDMLKYLMEEHDLTGDDLACILRADRSLAYRILNAQRNLTIAHIKALSSRFNISAGVFID